MIRAVIAVADQVIVQELRSRLEQTDADVEIAFVAESTSEMVSAVLAQRPAIAFVHDQLGPGPVMQAVRDLTLRNPALAVLMVSTRGDAEAFEGALEAGARGVLTHPFGLEDLNNRLTTLVEWNSTVRRALAGSESEQAGNRTRGAKLVAVAGAKGGVGATVVATHLAWDAATSDRRMRVCLVDLDVENGDVPSYLDVSHRVSIADLAKISDDLTPRAVADVVVAHSSGLHLLLAPTEIRDTEVVTPQAVRRILAQLRSLYHLVVLDVGAAITTTQAAAVESSDVTLQLVTADVPALRSARRQVVAWESLGVTGADSVKVVVNRFLRRSEIQQDTIDALTLGQRSQVLIPDLERGLERAGNSRTPAEVKNQTWWKSLRAIGQELDITSAFRDALAAENASADAVEARSSVNGSRREGGRLRRSRRPVADAGQASLETAAIFPFALLLLGICLQMILFGVSMAYSGVAAGAAARAVSIGTDPAVAVAEALPAGMAATTDVAASGRTVRVTVRAPLLLGDGVTRDVAIDVDHRVVKEPR